MQFLIPFAIGWTFHQDDYKMTVVDNAGLIDLNENGLGSKEHIGDEEITLYRTHTDPECHEYGNILLVAASELLDGSFTHSTHCDGTKTANRIDQFAAAMHYLSHTPLQSFNKHPIEVVTDTVDSSLTITQGDKSLKTTFGHCSDPYHYSECAINAINNLNKVKELVSKWNYRQPSFNHDEVVYMVARLQKPASSNSRDVVEHIHHYYTTELSANRVKGESERDVIICRHPDGEYRIIARWSVVAKTWDGITEPIFVTFPFGDQ